MANVDLKDPRARTTMASSHGHGDSTAVLLHGVLELTVLEADKLHGAVHSHLLQATEKLEETLGLPEVAHNKLYTTVSIGATSIAETRMVEHQPVNPVWNQSFRVYVAYAATEIVFAVKDHHSVGAKVVGTASLPAATVASGQVFQGWLDIHGEHGGLFHHHSSHHKPQIHVVVRYVDVATDPSWGAGIQPAHFAGVKPAFFPERTGCAVTLYQNTHLSNEFKPAIQLDGSVRQYQPSRLWEDLYIAVRDAKHFIYVAGWSVNTNITLVRDKDRMIPGAEGVTIGELLKRKADEGLAVLVMVWQDRTSALGSGGLMHTHCEETYNYFKGSNVKCFMCPRNADHTLSFVQNVDIDIEFTHHQKTVTLDATTSGGHGRHVVSFVGGIDICGGRYDNEEHTLFGGLNTVYADDFMQESLAHADLKHGGPREPWHDVHSKVEGPAAWDVLTNFEQRWKKQAPPEFAGALVGVTSQEFPDPTGLDGKESWNVQVFRSIDDASVVLFPSNPVDAADLGLTSWKDLTIDQSVHAGYVEAIRRAKRFIYIQNQYFLGSSAWWKESKDAGCDNLVPIEIALKIASKIKQGERFAVYVVTPMWPNGVPESDSTQAILHWNRLTIEMMYGIVAKAIDDAGLTGKVEPRHYLNFLCLGKRETPKDGEYEPPEKPDRGSDYARAQNHRRFMIYVHSKVMIVDDEYVIVGSANINQRSLAGNRDSEIAVGSYQPAHLNAGGHLPRGQVHGFRMSLWHEHFLSHVKHNTQVFLEPESLECVRAIRNGGDKLWEMYAQDTVLDLPGHLLPFPVHVSEHGEVSDLPEDGFFPDTKAPVKGKKSSYLPSLLTT